MQLIAQVLQALELAYVYSQSSYILVGQMVPQQAFSATMKNFFTLLATFIDSTGLQTSV